MNSLTFPTADVVKTSGRSEEALEETPEEHVVQEGMTEDEEAEEVEDAFDRLMALTS